MFKTLRKYFSLYHAMFKASLIADLEYRANFLTRIVTDIFWYIAQITTFEVLYKHTTHIGDWNVQQMRVFLGILFIADALYMMLLHDNIENLSEKVRKGDLDLLLTKPVNAQFMLSLQKASSAYVGNLTMGILWLLYSLINLGDFNYLRLLWLLVLIPCGLVVIYATKFMFATTAVIFARSDNILFLWWQIYRLGMRPDSMYFPWFKWIILTVVPIGLVASVPARALLDPPNYFILLWPLILSPLLIYISNRFWKYAMRFYSSASS
jgi:ABC-2 type transport system permease protein